MAYCVVALRLLMRSQSPRVQALSAPLLLSIVLGSACLGGIILFTAYRVTWFRAAGASARVDIKSELRRWNAQSDEEVLQTTVEDVRRFILSKGKAAPTFGISRGHYSKASAHSLSKLTETCNFQPFNSTNPPSALMLPGLLSARSVEHASSLECAAALGRW